MVGLAEWQMRKIATQKRNDYDRSDASDQIETVAPAPLRLRGRLWFE
jgi:hypothetical protein